MIRATILAVTGAILLCLWLDRPMPVKTVQVDYCMVSYRTQAFDQFGLPHIIWTQGYGPCSQLDRFENI
ncbi:hypothetical protein ABIF96_005810 [Bradyrhizobium ottawaense]|uniref:hypothetical protein n=1 Tax=Bradyrhizobium ottawaense TaxID=931866 RepID=UPI0038332E8A